MKELKQESIDKAKNWLEENGYDPGYNVIIGATEHETVMQFLYIILAAFSEDIND